MSAAAPGVLPAAPGPELLCEAGSRDPTAGRPVVTHPATRRDITLRYKETRRQKQQSRDDQGRADGSVDGRTPGPDDASGPEEADREGVPAPH